MRRFGRTAAVFLSLVGNSMAEEGSLDQVVITATKLPEPARASAGSTTITSGAQLDDLGAQSYADYLTQIPGVVFNASQPGLSTAVIRGISTTSFLDQGQGTTGYFLNEVPLTDPGFAVAIPDIDTFDVENIAVMRGPQGTLFGSASLGGAINYQTTPSDPTAFHARLQATFANTLHGADSGSGKGMINLPLIPDELAVRGVFVYRNDGGFINNIGTSVKDANDTLIRGGRVQVLWTPFEGTRLSYLYLKQIEGIADLPYQEPYVAGPLEKATLLPERFLFTTTINNLRLDQHVSFGTLTMTATYHQKSRGTTSDLTAALGRFVGNQLRPIDLVEADDSHGTTFEVRLTSPNEQRLTWLAGAMRDLTRELFLGRVYAPGAQQYASTVLDPAFGSGFGASVAANNLLNVGTTGTTGDERGLFGQSTYHFDDHWAVTFGGRYFDTGIVGRTSSGGLLEYLQSDPKVLSFAYASTERSRGFTPKISMTWNASADAIVYALADKGFRLGGPNVNPPSASNPFPLNYGPDSLWNYEFGTKTNWFDRRLQLDATAFYIDWNHIQVRLATARGLSYGTNLGKAASYGLENSAVWSITSNLGFSGSLTYLNATLKQAFRAGAHIEPAGTVLPGASRWNAVGSVKYQLSGVSFLHPAVELTDRYISSAPAGFGYVAPITQGNFNILDCRISGFLNDLRATLFLNNIIDRRGVTTATYSPGSPLKQYLVRPRTVGVTLDYRY